MGLAVWRACCGNAVFTAVLLRSTTRPSLEHGVLWRRKMKVFDPPSPPPNATWIELSLEGRGSTNFTSHNHNGWSTRQPPRREAKKLQVGRLPRCCAHVRTRNKHRQALLVDGQNRKQHALGKKKAATHKTAAMATPPEGALTHGFARSKKTDRNKATRKNAPNKHHQDRSTKRQKNDQKRTEATLMKKNTERTTNSTTRQQQQQQQTAGDRHSLS